MLVHITCSSIFFTVARFTIDRLNLGLFYILLLFFHIHIWCIYSSYLSIISKFPALFGYSHYFGYLFSGSF